MQQDHGCVARKAGAAQLRALAAAARFIANAAAATDQLGISAGGQLPIMASSETDDDADVIYDATNGDADTER